MPTQRLHLRDRERPLGGEELGDAALPAQDVVQTRPRFAALSEREVNDLLRRQGYVVTDGRVDVIVRGDQHRQKLEPLTLRAIGRRILIQQRKYLSVRSLVLIVITKHVRR